MQATTDWLELWRELAQVQAARWKGQRGAQGGDVWRERARAYDAQVKAQWAKPDSSRGYVVAQLKAHPDWTALDIGGGTGAWAVLMSQHARHVTVVEPSPAMREVMRENLAAVGASNVTIIEAEWPDVEVGEHDLTLCAHAMYGLPDLAGFVQSLEAVTRKLCVLVMRTPIPDGLMAQAAQRVWGQPHDSPNFQVAYNGLLQLGVFADVRMESTGLWDPWTSPSLEEACAEIKRRLSIDTGEHDAFLWDLVQRNLICEGGDYVWPRGVRSALVSWSVSREH